MSEDSEKVLSDSLHAMAQDIKARDEEIERLRDDLQRATSMPMATEAARNVALEKKVDQQKAEIERLRGLLRDARDLLSEVGSTQLRADKMYDEIQKVLSDE
jgi:SMC interacting uncharacterized protein involved in chromosome segregation